MRAPLPFLLALVLTSCRVGYEPADLAADHLSNSAGGVAAGGTSGGAGFGGSSMVGWGGASAQGGTAPVTGGSDTGGSGAVAAGGTATGGTNGTTTAATGAAATVVVTGGMATAVTGGTATGGTSGTAIVGTGGTATAATGGTATVASGGTATVASGGTATVASGGMATVASGGTAPVSARSVALDGLSEYLSAGDLTLASGSISLWFKTSNGTSGYLVSRVQAGASVKGEFRLMLELGQLVLRTESPAVNEIRGDGTVADGLWHHVVATFNSGLALYVDGVVQTATNTSNKSGIEVAGVSLEFGRNNGLLDSYFGGLLDEIAFYDVRLSAAQVTELYNQGAPADLQALSTGSSLVHWWRLGEGDTSPLLHDIVGGVDATMVNMDATNFS